MCCGGARMLTCDIALPAFGRKRLQPFAVSLLRSLRICALQHYYVQLCFTYLSLALRAALLYVVSDLCFRLLGFTLLGFA